MSQPREIPGMYYDSEKKKYFKIQANVPSSSPYSSQNVKRRKVDDADKQAQIMRVQRNIGRIKRAQILHDPIRGGFLSVGFGQPGLNAVAASLYAQNLAQSDFDLHFLGTRGARFFAAMPRRSEINDTSVIFTSTSDQYVYNHLFDCETTRKSSGMSFWSPPGIIHNFLPLQFTSLSINEAYERVAATWSGGGAYTGIAITRPYDPSVNVVIGPGETRTPVDIFSSTSAPPSSQYLFAIGSSQGILLIDKDLDTTWMQHQPSVNPDNHPRDVFALDFHPNHKDILLTGERRGILNAIDFRQPPFGYAAKKIQHTSRITYIKCLDEHRILVAGSVSDLCQYDKRFLKQNTDPVPSHKNKNTGRHTTSYLTYPNHRDNGNPHVGLDVDLELGIIATGHFNKIRLFSLHGGQVLKDLNLPDPDAPYGFPQRPLDVECLKFVQDTRNQPKSLWASFPKEAGL